VVVWGVPGFNELSRGDQNYLIGLQASGKLVVTG